MDLKHLKQEPVLVQHVQSDPAVLVKEENLENSMQDDVEQQCVPGASTPASAGSVNEACNTSLSDLLNVKHEPSEMDVAPTVLQHMDTHYTISKNISTVTEKNMVADDCNKPMPYTRVKKESVTDKLRDSSSNQVHVSEDRKHQRNIRCNKCLKVFKSKIYRNQHSKQVHGSESHKCTQCNKEFKCKLYLVRHVRFTHSKEQYKCDICKRMYKSLAVLNNHVSSFHRNKFADPEDDNDYRCDKCSKTFQSKISFKNHCRYMHGTERYGCKECHKEYKWKAYLRSHIKNVHGNEQYECDICNKIYTSKLGLSRHILTLHSHKFPEPEDGNYRCDKCMKTYQSKIVFMNHSRYMHGTERNKCTKCDKEYKWLPYIRNHIKSVHSNKQYECDICTKIYFSRHGISRHVLLHGDRFPDSQPYLLPSVRSSVQRTYSRSLLPKNAVVMSAVAGTSAEQSGAVAVKSEPADAKLELGPVADIQPCLPLVQSFVQRTYSRSSFPKNAVVCTSRQECGAIDMKSEPADAELELGPVVFQHMDLYYRPLKEEPQKD